MATSEFTHYTGCNGHDPDNCSACALTDRRQSAPNYAGWPLVYMENGRAVPSYWEAAFNAEFERTDNPAYVANLNATRAKYGVRFTN